MKVLFVSSGNSHYGIVPFIKSQGESLIEKGIDLVFFKIKGNGIRGYLKNIKLLRNHINQNSYDIIHAHYGLTGLVCVMAHTKVPVVLSVMGSDAYGAFNIDGKREKSSYLDMFITQIALLFVKAIIVKSSNILKFVPYLNKSYIIPNGVNFKLFKPYKNKLNCKSVLFLANNSDPRKNYKLLKSALELLRNKDVLLLNPYPIDQSQFPHFLNKASVFVLTSYNEGSPNVIKEAMACNIPIVATDVGDIKKVIGNTKGCYISSFESQDVADKIQKALDFGKRTTGREDVKHLESSVIADKIIEVYKSVLTKK